MLVRVLRLNSIRKAGFFVLFPTLLTCENPRLRALWNVAGQRLLPS